MYLGLVFRVCVLCQFMHYWIFQILVCQWQHHCTAVLRKWILYLKYCQWLFSDQNTVLRTDIPAGILGLFSLISEGSFIWTASGQAFQKDLFFLRTELVLTSQALVQYWLLQRWSAANKTITPLLEFGLIILSELILIWNLIRSQQNKLYQYRKNVLSETAANF